MINKRLISSRTDSAECGNGLTCDGNDYKKRKGRKHDRQRVFMTQNDYRKRLQEILYSPEHILMKIFRKDGPTLGGQFDSLPSNAFLRDCRRPHHEENGRSTHRKRKVCITHRKRKVSMHAMLDYQVCCENSSLGNRHGAGKGPITAKGAPTKKHGMGKGFMSESNAPGKKHGKGKSLMTVWRVTNPDATDFSYGVDFSESTIQKKKKRLQRQQAIVRKLANKEQTSRKTSLRSRKMECQKVQKQKQPHKEKCELALEDMKCLENSEHFAVLLDDEELELQELQSGPIPLSCSAHFPTNGSHGCSLCKDLLARFPPSSVTMKLPLFMQPWASSQELTSKLFKVFQFLCTYACTISMYSFTLEEFAHAFHDKDSLLLGQVHLALLKLLLKDVDKELGRGFLSHASKNCKFLRLLHSLEHHTSVLELWHSSLNLLTWTEILRQVLVAAGFGPKLSMEPKEASNNKEVDLMEKYALRPGTLKGELFNILLKQGNSGMKVSELAQSSSIVELSLADTLNDLENIIMLALSGDMTLFEKISSSGYRLRINAAAKECEDCPSGSEDFGSVDDTSEVSIVQDNETDSEHGSRDSGPFELGQNVYKNQSEMLTMYNEIDESYPGEVWLLGLMEGEYSDLNIDEKLSALSALIDLLSGGSTVRMEDPLTSIAECSQNINSYSSGAKIKRSTTKQCSLPQSGRSGQTLGDLGTGTSGQPTDSLVTMSKISDEEKYENMKMIAEEFEVDGYIHPMQSIFLGSDRRYNRYWLFLGPCDESDPGHRRIYFESSEDGHWEVIDMPEALCTLMLTLNRRGAREAQLLASLEKREAFLFQAMSSTHNDVENGKLAPFDQSEINTSRESSSSPVSDVDNHLNLNEISNNLPSSTGTELVEDGVKGGQTEISGHSLAFDVYLWKSFYYKLKTVRNMKKAYLDSLRRCDQCHDLYWRDEKHCRICHTTFELDFDLEERYAIHYAVCQVNSDASKCRRPRVLSSRLQSLKAAIYAIESVVPEDALFGSWKRSAHNLWVNRLRRASNLAEFLQVLADFVTAIKEDWFYQNCNTSGSYCIQDIFSDFSTMPHTCSAVALWIVKLDLLVASHMESCKYQNKSKSCR